MHVCGVSIYKAKGFITLSALILWKKGGSLHVLNSCKVSRNVVFKLRILVPLLVTRAVSLK